MDEVMAVIRMKETLSKIDGWKATTMVDAGD
jgi:hypothetical protein